MGEIIYAFGYTGLQMLLQIIVADITTLRWRGLVGGLVTAPFIVNIFVSAEIAAGVLPDWRWGFLMVRVLGLVPALLTTVCYSCADIPCPSHWCTALVTTQG